jgi:hypothetical protein
MATVFLNRSSQSIWVGFGPKKIYACVPTCTWYCHSCAALRRLFIDILQTRLRGASARQVGETGNWPGHKRAQRALKILSLCSVSAFVAKAFWPSPQASVALRVAS